MPRKVLTVVSHRCGPFFGEKSREWKKEQCIQDSFKAQNRWNNKKTKQKLQTMLSSVHHAPLIARSLNQWGHLGHVACKRKKEMCTHLVVKPHRQKLFGRWRHKYKNTSGNDFKDTNYKNEECVYFVLDWIQLAGCTVTLSFQWNIFLFL